MGGTKQSSFRLDDEVLAELDAEVASLERERPGVRHTRTSVLRELVRECVAARQARRSAPSVVATSTVVAPDPIPFVVTPSRDALRAALSRPGAIDLDGVLRLLRR